MESERVDSYDLMVSQPFLSPRGSELQWILQAVREISLRIKQQTEFQVANKSLSVVVGGDQPTCRIKSAGNVAVNL